MRVRACRLNGSGGGGGVHRPRRRGGGGGGGGVGAFGGRRVVASTREDEEGRHDETAKSGGVETKLHARRSLALARARQRVRWGAVRIPTNPEVRARVDRLELPWSDYGTDPYGVSKDSLALWFSAVKFFYRHYFSVDAHGLEHIPKVGRAMLVGNHSGGFALDGMMTVCSLFFDQEPPRLAQAMVEKFMSAVPFGAQMSSRLGHLTGLPEHAERLLADDRALMVFPEGVKGTAKLYGARYSLVNFGTGFVRLAMKMKTPIVPFAFLGGGEVVLDDLERGARSGGCSACHTSRSRRGVSRSRSRRSSRSITRRR